MIGLGAIGQALLKTAIAFGMEIWGYDPFISPETCLSLQASAYIVDSLNILYEKCDFITLHAPSTQETRRMIDTQAIAKMKPGMFLINFARADLVDNAAIVDGIKSGHIAGYFTDFPAKEFLGIDQIIASPHLGGRTFQASDKCAVMAVSQLKNYLENGSIVNAVNFPSVSLSSDFSGRICILHKLSRNILDKILAAAEKDEIIPDHIVSNHKGEYGYTVIDTSASAPAYGGVHIRRISEVLRVRVLSS